LAIQVSVSNLNPTPSEIVKFTGSADPVEDIILDVYNEADTQIASFTIYLKTHGINYVNLIPGILPAVQQTWRFHGKDTGSEAPSVVIAIQQEVPPEISIALSVDKTVVKPTDIVTFTITTAPSATYTVTLEAYVNGVLSATWRVPVTDGVGTTRLVPGEIGDVVDWVAKDDFGNQSNTVTTVMEAAGPPEGVITAIRVQDISRQVWFNWDKGVGWTPKPPEITPGTGNLYVACWVTNDGATGNITITIKDDQETILGSKTENVAAGEGVGIEYTGAMPNRSYSITLIPNPGSPLTFSIKPLTGAPTPPGFFDQIGEWWSSLPWWQKTLVATTGAVGIAGAAAAIIRRKKS